MHSRLLLAGALLASLPSLLFAQSQDGDATSQPQAEAALLKFKYAQFDPTTTDPFIPGFLRSQATTRLWVVQFAGVPEQSWRDELVGLGAEVHSYVPENAHVVRMSSSLAGQVSDLPTVRFVGPYHAAFRLEAEIREAMVQGTVLPKQKYNLVVVDKRRDKPALAAAIEAIGGIVEDQHEGSILFTATLDAAQVVAAANLDEVLWIDRWTPNEEDMDNGRIQGGGNHVEAQGGYTGSGIRGHVYEGAEATHQDFRFALTNVRSGGQAESHGHCTAGIVFGDGTSNPAARGMAPDARGYYTNYNSVTTSRINVINDVVNVHDCMFTTASWGAARTTQYTSISADTDDIIFTHRIPWTQSQSNAGNQNSRPQAWAKNIFSIGAVDHFNNSNAGDDSWAAGNASTGPASDGRIKPDLCAYYDQILTSDRTGNAGYSSQNWYSNFGGTSGATPMVAGHNALAIQMYTDFIFGNDPRVPGGTRFQNRPYAQTLKALMIACAEQYTFTPASTDNRREHQGWGFPNLRTMYDNRGKIFIVPEDNALTQGQTESYQIVVAPSESELKICMSFLEPAGNPAATNAAVNDLSLRVTSPSGTVYWGNNGLDTRMYSTSGGSANTIDSVECVFVDNPAAGTWTVEVRATQINQDANAATGATDATYALVVNGGQVQTGSACADYPDGNAPDTGTRNIIPFGGPFPSNLDTVFASNNSGSIDGAVYFDLTVNNALRLEQFAINTGTAAGSGIGLDVYMTAQGTSYAGNEANSGAWTLVGTGYGTSNGLDEKSYVALRTRPVLAPGTYGVALVAKGFNHRYTNGNGSNENYSDSNIALALGSATNVPFTGSPFSPRVANIEVDYTRLSSGSLTTTFASNNRGSVGGAVYFDLTANQSITLTGFDVNSDATSGTAISIDVYRTARGASYAGNETNAGAWTLVASGAGTSAGTDNPSAMALDRAVRLTDGSYGIAIVANGFGHQYTNGALTPSNSVISLSTGSATNVPFSGSPFRPRSANVTVRYGTLSQTYVNQRMQQIVRAADLTKRGAITGLAFAAAGTGEYRFDSIQVRMSHVRAGTTLSNTFSTNLPSPVEVFRTTDHFWPVTGGEWNEVGLQQPFIYNGRDDIVIEVITTGCDSAVNLGGFHRTSTTPRVWATGWTRLPGTATGSGNTGQKIRLDFGCANLEIYGRGCGDLELRTSGVPDLGGSYTLDAYLALPGQPVFLNLGITNRAPFPLALGGIGFPGCTAYHDALITLGGSANANGVASISLTTPNNRALVGLALYSQYLQLNRGAPGGATVSNYARILNGLSL